MIKTSEEAEDDLMELIKTAHHNFTFFGDKTDKDFIEYVKKVIWDPIAQEHVDAGIKVGINCTLHEYRKRRETARCEYCGKQGRDTNNDQEKFMILTESICNKCGRKFFNNWDSEDPLTITKKEEDVGNVTLKPIKDGGFLQ